MFLADLLELKIILMYKLLVSGNSGTQCTLVIKKLITVITTRDTTPHCFNVLKYNYRSTIIIIMFIYV